MAVDRRGAEESGRRLTPGLPNGISGPLTGVPGSSTPEVVEECGSVGTWDVGHFDNDSAADFAGDLDEAMLGERESLIRGVLQRTADAAEHLMEAQRAVAAAALVAAQCPGGEPVEPGYAPEQAMPVFSEDLRTLAAEALDRVMGDEWSVESWASDADRAKWLDGLRRLRDVIAPPAPPGVPLFEVGEA